MKWSLQQLIKLTQRPFSFEESYDFSEEASKIEDILSIGEIKVEGTVSRLYDDRYEFDLHIWGILTLEDARTLEPAPFEVDLKVTEVFDKVVNDDEDVRYIEKNTVDLREVIWENILLEKPIRFVKED